STDGYNSEAPERLHIDCVKVPYRASNKVNPTEQMALHLQRQEAWALVHAQLEEVGMLPRRKVMRSSGDFGDEDEGDGEGEDGTGVGRRTTIHEGGELEDQDEYDYQDPDQQVEREEGEVQVMRAAGRGRNRRVHQPLPNIKIAKRPPHPSTLGAHLINAHGATDLIPAITRYLGREYPNHPPLYLAEESAFQVWTRCTLQHRPLPFSPLVGSHVDSVRAFPATYDLDGRRDRTAYFDTVLIEEFPDRPGLHRYRAGRVRAIFRLPVHLRRLCPDHLVFVELFGEFSPARHPRLPREQLLGTSGALAPLPLRNHSAYADADVPVPLSARVDQCMSLCGTGYSGRYPTNLATPTCPSAIQTLSTACQGYLYTPPTITTRSLHTPSSHLNTAMNTPTTAILVTPASAISPVSPIRSHFQLPMTHTPTGSAGEGVRVARSKRKMECDQTRRTRAPGSARPSLGWMTTPSSASCRSAPCPCPCLLVLLRGRPGVRCKATSRRMWLLYGPAGVTLAPAELARDNACDKLPQVPSHVPPHQQTFYGIQSMRMPVMDVSGRFATICAPGMRPVLVPSRPMYPLAGLAPLVAGHQGLPHGGLTAPIERGDEVQEWKDLQCAKERADVVVKDGELTAAERIEMEQRVSMSVKVINHIYNGPDDVPKTRSPAQPTHRLPDERSSYDDAAPSTLAPANHQAGSLRENAYPPTPSSMPSSPESPKTRRDRQRASMRKDAFGERDASKLEEIVREIEEEVDLTWNPWHTLTRFVAEVLAHSRTSINLF
ncbi:hypothetical protein FRC06_007185, partial [Ceratobasidium sp. 370]